jgi:uncharacterized membrane protein YgcG
MRKLSSMWVVASVVAVVFAPSTARAHFTLDYPTSWTVDTNAGDPQKAYPCGVLPTDTFTSSKAVTTFAPGQKITVKWTERVAHAGWFRIALSYLNGAEFETTTDFPEPLYQTVGTPPNSTSIDAGIENPPVLPVLADGLWKHPGTNLPPTQYASDITLPTMPCQKCVLQVLQIMLNHPINAPDNNPDGGNGAGFTYHHCAYIAIEPGADGGTQAMPDAGPDAVASGSSGSGSGSSGASGSGSGGSGGVSGSGSTGSGSGSSGACASGSGACGSSSTGGSGGPGGSGNGGSSGGIDLPRDDASSPGLDASGGGGEGSGSGGCSLVRRNAESAGGLASLWLTAAIVLRRRRRL